MTLAPDATLDRPSALALPFTLPRTFPNGGHPVMRAPMRPPSPAAPDLLARYRAYLTVERYRAAKTITNYLGTLRLFWRHAGIPPDRIGPEQLAAFLGRRPTSPSARGRRALSDMSKHVEATRIRRFYTVAHAKGWLASNPLADVRIPTAHLGPPRDVPLEKVAVLLLHVADKPRDELLVWCAYGVGLRAEEIAGARLEDLALGGRPCIRVTGKGRKTRVVPLAPPVAAVLSRATAGRPVTGPLVDNRKHPGEQLTPKYVSRLLSETIHDAGIDATGHQLRHSFATTILAESGGTALHALSRLLGHASVKTTEKYVSSFDADAWAAVKLLPDPRRL